MRRQPKNRARFSPRARPCHRSTPSRRTTRAPDRRAAWPRAHRCARRRKNSPPTLASFLAPSAVPRRPCRNGAEFAGRSTVVICENGQLSEGVAAWLRHAGAASAEVLAGGHAAWANASLPRCPRPNCPARSTRAHGLGYARAAQSRSHRLSMAHPPLCRSGSGVPVCRAERRCSRSAIVSPAHLSTSKASSGAIAASAARSTSCWRNSGLATASLTAACFDCAWRRYRAPGPRARGPGPARGLARIVADVCGRS